MKTTMRLHFTQTRMPVVIFFKVEFNEYWWYCGTTGTFICCWWECKMVLLLWKPDWPFFGKLNVESPYDPEYDLNISEVLKFQWWKWVTGKKYCLKILLRTVRNTRYHHFKMSFSIGPVNGKQSYRTISFIYWQLLYFWMTDTALKIPYEIFGSSSVYWFTRAFI